MKLYFVEGKYSRKVILPDSLISRLPKRVVLFTTIQFTGSLTSMKEQIESSGREAILLRSGHAKYDGQILGCTIEAIEEGDAFLYIGDGLFHPKALAMKNTKDIFIYNPLTGRDSMLTQDDVKGLLAREKGAYAKFLASSEVCVLVSTKPGQNSLARALKLREKYPEKNFYYLVFDTIDFSQLDNFPFAECFVNTACPRIGLDDTERSGKPILNMDMVYSL